jgi:large subunit ribosomal protein L21
MYAVMKTGGKQYRVSKGDKLKVEKIAGKVGEEVHFDEILMIGGTPKVQVGKPKVAGASVTAKILEQDRAKKVIVYKVKKRKKYRKTQGHRQAYTRIEITQIKSNA